MQVITNRVGGTAGECKAGNCMLYINDITKSQIVTIVAVIESVDASTEYVRCHVADGCLVVSHPPDLLRAVWDCASSGDEGRTSGFEPRLSVLWLRRIRQLRCVSR